MGAEVSVIEEVKETEYGLESLLPQADKMLENMNLFENEN